MKSPCLDVIAKRRYHKPKHKPKRKEFTKCHNKENSKSKQTTRITQKRLTKYYFKNAVVSSPHVRGTRGHLMDGPKRGCTEFDLQCLLKAAKGSNTAAVSHSSSSTSSEELDEPCHVDDALLEENNNRLKNRVFEPRSRSNLKSTFKSSAGNNPHLLENKTRDFSDLEHIDRHISSQDVMDSDLENHCVDNVSAKEQNLDPNISSENSATQIKLKLGSFSSYYKFAIGITAALVSEKKKQCPHESYLHDIGKDVTNIYIKSREILTKKVHFSTNKDKSQLENCQQSQQLPCVVLENMSSSVESHSKNQKKDLQKRNDHVTVPRTDLPKREQKEKTFRERSVEAWIEALPENMPLQDSKKRTKVHNFPSKSEAAQTEEEFLRKFEKSHLFQSQHSKHVPHLLKIENPVNEFEHWHEGSCMMDIASPSASPCMPPQEDVFSIPLTNDCSKIVNEDTANIFEPNLAPFKRNVNVDEFWQKPFIQSTNDHESAFWERRNYFPLKNQDIQNQKSQQSWLSWFTKRDENKKTGERRLESPTCISTSPYFIFDPPISKRTCVRDTSAGVKTSMHETVRNSKIKDKKPVWNPFPKLLERNPTKKLLPRVMTFDNQSDRRRCNIEEPSSPSSIKFSPRNMF